MKFRAMRRGADDLALVPADGMSEQAVEKLRPGVVYELSTRKDRSEPQHRLFFACCDLLAENIDGLDKDAVVLLTKIKCGLGTPVELVRTRELVIVPRSIAIESMAGDDFTDFFTSAKRFWCADLIPGLGNNDLMREAINLLGEGNAAQRRR